jgi:(2Fe-2S) ferredoxin
MNSSKYCVFVCTKKRSPNDLERCCYDAGALDIYQAFQDEVERLELNNHVKVSKSGCLGRCEAGVVAMVYQPRWSEFSWLPTKLRMKLKKILFPNRILYGHLTTTDVCAIAQSHFIKGKKLKLRQISTTK